MKKIKTNRKRILSLFLAIAFILTTEMSFETQYSYAGKKEAPIDGSQNQTVDTKVSGVWNGSSVDDLRITVVSPKKDQEYFLLKTDGNGSISRIGNAIKAEDKKIRENPSFVSWNEIISSSENVNNTYSVISNLKNDQIDKMLRGEPLPKEIADKLNQSEKLTAGEIVCSVLEQEKSGFSQWLSGSFIEDFGGSVPKSVGDIYEAFAVYVNVPAVSVSGVSKGDSYILSAVVSDNGEYEFEWQYLDADGTWKKLTEETTADVDVSDCEELLDGGAKVRARTETVSGIALVSNAVFVNPLQENYDNAVAAINKGLDLANSKVYWRVRNSAPNEMTIDLSIGSERFSKYFYYDNLSKDIPVTDAESYANYLAKTYLDAGSGEEGLAAAKEVWDRYLYDIYDPSYDAGMLKNLDGGIYPDNTYGDKANHIKWPKDEASSFNTDPSLAPELKDLDYDYLRRGADYSKAIDTERGLHKKVTAAAAGDANGERKYNVELDADVNMEEKAPVAMILQVQSSWQMFDLAHANCVKGDGTYDTIEVGGAANNTELANLYDVKKALLKFADYMEENYKGNNLLLGVTETQHAHSSSLFYQGTSNVKADPKKKVDPKKAGSGSVTDMYVTNDHDSIIKGLQLWNSFGNCEHVHYDSECLENAVSALRSNLKGWTDSEKYALDYDDVRKVAVIVGGSTENTTGTNGYGITLPWDTFRNAQLNGVYAIRTNEAVPVAENAQGCISWLEYSGNMGAGKTPFQDGSGNTYTKEYVAPTSEDIFNTLVEIADREMAAQGVDKTSSSVFVEDLTVSDTVQDEFDIDADADIVATVYYADGTVKEERTVSRNDRNLKISENGDGTTTVMYNFGKVYSGCTAKLHFGIQAKDDFIGSNNVFSNVDTPLLTYEHTVTDENGNPTAVVESYTAGSVDTPQVNVPIAFAVGDGKTVEVPVGEDVDLAKLDADHIVKDAYEAVQMYDQTNGRLSFEWEYEGKRYPVPVNVFVKNGEIDGQLPDVSEFSKVVTPEEIGEHYGKLHVTFTPEEITDSENFADCMTAEPVNAKTESGNVGIIAKETKTDYRVEYIDRDSGDLLGSEDFKDCKIGEVVTADAPLMIGDFDLDDERSKSLELTRDSSINIIQFYYAKAEAKYTVRCIDVETGDKIIPDETFGGVKVGVSKTVLAPNLTDLLYSPVAPTSIRKKLVRDENENIYIFKYRHNG